jgi:hypothetical protein
VLVVVHGTSREAQIERALWAEFAETNNVVLLCPLFPAGIESDTDLSGYKTLKIGQANSQIQYDKVLMQMLEQANHTYPDLHVTPFYLAGHSGGAQFCLQYTIMHPEHVSSIMLSAPGKVTLIDDSYPWPAGTSNVRVNLTALRKIPFILTIGSQDSGEDLLALADFVNPQAIFGRTRIERISKLAENLNTLGITNQLTIVRGGIHSDKTRIPVFQRVLEEQFHV